MKRIIILFFLLSCQGLMGQRDAVIATLDKQPITFGELYYAYQKNRDITEAVNYDSLRAYLDQYIDFKLKVGEAYNLGLHQQPTFQQELEGYISQIKKPYLENPALEDAKLKAIYNRLNYEVNAAHILLKIDPMAIPADTLKAYQKLDSIRSLATNQDEFSTLARNFSQDGSARKGGDLGWFTAFHMVAPFEDAAYDLEVGEVSQVFRTRFGYHIMILKNKRPTRGKLRVSHIYFAKNIHGNSLAEQKAKVFYDSIKAGASWELIAQSQSDDKRSATNGGLLPLAGIRQLPDDFFDEIYKIEKVGDISEPFETSTGWHIARLEEVEPLFEYRFKKKEIAYQLQRSGRNEFTEVEVITNLKSQPSFKQDDLIENLSLGFKNPNKLKKELAFEYEGVEVPWVEFFKNEKGFKSLEKLTSEYLRFENERILEIEDSIASKKYPEYGYLLQEFEEGLLLFEVMQLKIWGPSSEDSLSLSKYFEANRNRYTDIELSGEVLTAEPAVISEMYQDLKLQNVFSRSQLVTQFSGSELKIAKSTRMGREIPNFDSNSVKADSWIQLNEKTLMFIERFEEKPLSLDQSRGIVLADFQDWLTRDWVKNLRKAKRIKVDEKKLKQLLNFE